jgi:hypothetical protein
MSAVIGVILAILAVFVLIKVGLFILKLVAVLVLILAVVIATASFFLLGALLLPALGLSGQWLTMIPGAVSGGTIALIYFTMFRKPDGA